MKENHFTELFKRYKWTVEEVGENSYIAYNNVFMVAFSPNSSTADPTASAVSYHVMDKDAVTQAWKNYNRDSCSRLPIDIGTFAFKDYMNGCKKFFHIGAVANHDHMPWEIENWLKRMESH